MEQIQREIQWLERRVTATESLANQVALNTAALAAVQSAVNEVHRELDDHIRAVNDRFGHQVEERVADLRETSRERTAAIRWRIATLLVAIGSIIAATGLILAAIGHTS